MVGVSDAGPARRARDGVAVRSGPASPYPRLLREGALRLHYQPVLDLRSGAAITVEGLGRLAEDGELIAPGAFLPHLSDEQRCDLLLLSVDQGAVALRACGGTHPGLGLSLNLDPAVLLGPGFVPALIGRLAAAALDPRRLTLEILESGELGLDQARQKLSDLRRHGVRIGLDDVGSAYSSLLRLKELPVDLVKLDQGFVRGLRHNPEDLLFVSSVAALARGLGKQLVVEGVETPEILDAVQVMGAEAAQGYAIARPMPDAALPGWLARHVPVPARRQPGSLLGAYAAHLNLVEACRALQQPLPSARLAGVEDPHACLVGRFLDENGLHDTEYGRAHKRFHQALAVYDAQPVAWEAAADALRQLLRAAITRPSAGPACACPPEATRRPVAAGGGFTCAGAARA